VATELVPIVAELKKLQAHRIGLEHLTYFDDAFRFSSGNAVPHGTPEEILAAGREMYHQLAPETAKFIDFMMDSELFDVLSREGKAPGGYCTYLADSKAPFIFSNFNATADDVDVLTHEAGHAFASYLASFQDLPAENREPGMESCEIHSMSMEFLTSDYHHLFFGEDTAKYQLAHAEEALSFLPYGCMVDEFQHIVYDHPALSAEERNAAWADLERKYRPWIDFDALPFYGRGAGWQRQLHIYELPFYYIDYCLAQTVALQFFVAFLSDKKDAWQRYLALTSLAGTKNYTELIASAGFLSPFEPGNIQKVARSVADWIKTQQL
ncbi:MAG: M3 family oligoendopeptidase, partial [Pygmaiobacter sp.]